MSRSTKRCLLSFLVGLLLVGGILAFAYRPQSYEVLSQSTYYTPGARDVRTRGHALRSEADLENLAPELRPLVEPLLRNLDFERTSAVVSVNGAVTRIFNGRYGRAYILLKQDVGLSNSVTVTVINGRLTRPTQILVE